MSLQVWLPLTGDLRNQGISNVDASGVDTLTFTSSGKIGKALTSPINIARPASNWTQISVCMWLKPTGAGQWRDVFSFGTGQNRIESTTTSTTDVSFTWFVTSGPSLINQQSLFKIDMNKWCHICMTADGTYVKFYVNGVLTKTINQVNPVHSCLLSKDKLNFLTRDGISGSARFAGALNDIRIYDHCLSTKEIKEISKGLVLHYKLTGYSRNNLLTNTGFESRFSNENGPNITNKHEGIYATGWGGYNAGVANPTTVYHAHLVEKDNEWVYLYHKDSNNSWLGISQTITSAITPGTTYRFSCELYRISGSNYLTGGHYTRANSSATANSFVTWFDSNGSFTNAPKNKWVKYEVTLNVPATAYTNNGASFYIYGSNGGTGEFLMRRPKLEVGSTSTPWIPNTSDRMYSYLGYSDPVEYDCSGFSNNGTPSGTLLSVKDSPRYETCTAFNGSSYINAGKGAKVTDEITVSWWGYMNQWPSYTRAISCTEGGGWNFEPSSDSKFRFSLYVSGVGYILAEDTKTLSTLSSGWHHFVGTYDGLNSKMYIDSELRGTASNGKTTKTPIGYYDANSIFIGAEAAGSDTSPTIPYFTGNMSDLRIYSTALSAEDIKELYTVTSSIDNKGNLYSYEVKER